MSPAKKAAGTKTAKKRSEAAQKAAATRKANAEAEAEKRSEAAKKAAQTRAENKESTVKKSTPASELAGLVRRIRGDLAEAEKLAYAIPEASGVRPVVSQARAAFDRVGYVQEVDRL